MSVIAKYTLPAITGSHTDFPLLLRWADFSSEAIQAINDGGGNLRFYANQDGSNPLPCEVVEFDKTSNRANVYVKVPTLATGTVIYLGTDGTSQPAVTDPLGRNAVWSDYHIATHFGDGLVDSTGTFTWAERNTSGTSGIITDGIVGNAYDFKDINDGLYLDADLVQEGDDFTMSFWTQDNGVKSNLGYLFTVTDLDGQYNNFCICATREFTENGREHGIGIYSRATDSSTPTVVIVGDVGLGDRYLVSVRHIGSTGQSEVSVMVHNNLKTGVSERVLIGDYSVLEQIGLNMHRSSGGRAEPRDEPRITKQGILRSDDWVQAEYENVMSATSWGLMEAIESAPAQEFTSNATLTLDELSINAIMASTAPSFESYAHISLNEPQFQSTLSATAPEFTSSAHVEIEQPNFQSSAESTVPQFTSSASLTLEPISFSVYMGSAQTIASTAGLHINELEFSSTVQSTRPEFTSRAHIQTEIAFTSTLSSTPPQFVSYAALQIDDVSFATIEPTPQLDNIYVHEDAVITYVPKNNVVTYLPKNNVIRG